MKNKQTDYQNLVNNLEMYLNPQISFVPEELKRKNQLFQFLDRIDKEELGIDSISIIFNTSKEALSEDDIFLKYRD